MVLEKFDSSLISELRISFLEKIPTFLIQTFPHSHGIQKKKTSNIVAMLHAYDMNPFTLCHCWFSDFIGNSEKHKKQQYHAKPKKKK